MQKQRNSLKLQPVHASKWPVMFMLAVMLMFNVSPYAAYAQTGTADGTYDFSGLGANNSGGTGFQKIADKFAVSNGMVASLPPQGTVETSFYTDNQQNENTSGSITLKAEGGSVNNNFTFKDLGISIFEGAAPGDNVLSNLQIVLKDTAGSTIATIGGNGTYTMEVGSNVRIYQLSELMGSSDSYSYPNVASMDITWTFASGIAPSNLNFDNITVTNISATTDASAPVITSQPADVTTTVDGTANLSVAATASGTLSYQWYSNTTNSTTGGTLISGATASSYSAPTSTAGTTYYYVVVTNTDNSVNGTNTASTTSQTAAVTVNAVTNASPPTITTQPVDQTVNVDDTANLSVTATASGTLSYQWYSNTTNSTIGGTLISGATSSSYSAPTSAAGTTYYYVVVTNTDNSVNGTQTASTTSQIATVTVNALTNASPPTITTEPDDQTVNTGEAANLSVTATASGTLSYQWYRNTTNSNTGGTLISSATSSTYTIPTDTAGSFYYYVVVTNTDNTVNGNPTAAATSRAAHVTVNTITNASPPAILSQPVSQNVYVNDSAILAVNATASGTLSYQWYRNTTSSNTGGTPVSGAANSSYAAPTASAGTTYYYVVITNTDSSVNGAQTATITSQPASVTVKAKTNAEAPNITSQPSNRTVNVGEPVELTVAATASGTLSYQWYSNTTNSTTGSTAISSATGATYNAPTDTVGTLYYYVVITNNDDTSTGNPTASVTSQIVSVTVNTLNNAKAPVITAEPVDQTTAVGSPVTLSVTAAASGVLSYQWYENTTGSLSDARAIPTATSSTYTAPAADAGTIYYYVVVTNTDDSMNGSKTASSNSRLASVTVTAPFTYKVTYSGNGSTSGTSPTDANIYRQGDTVTVAANTGNLALSRHSFNGWNTQPDGFGTTYQPGQTLKIADQNITLYAIWQKDKDDNNNSGGGGSGGGSGGGTTPSNPSTPDPSAPVSSGADILVNGKIERAGTVTESEIGGQSAATVTIDQQRLADRLAAEGNGAVVTIPVTSNADIIIGELNGQMVSNMEQQQATLEIVTNRATYTIPANQINIASISSQLGSSVNLQDIQVRIRIAVPDADTLAIVNQAASAQSFSLVAPPVNLDIQAVHNGQVVDVSRFNAYVERSVVLPQDIDPNRITTGIVVEADGTTRHVPTKVEQRDNRYHAVINSLTNSTYAVVWHPITFSDVTQPWAVNAVNNMGSRMVVEGFEDGSFKPQQDITRAQFAAIIVKGLGLKNDAGGKTFSDVKSSDWFSGAVQTAASYGLIQGYADGTFKPQDKITREQAMVILSQAMKLSGLQDKLGSVNAASALNNFKDKNSVASWAHQAAAYNLKAGLVQGRSQQMLAPKMHVTRAEVALMVQNLLQKSDLI
ncbi:S-layer homology domain-containing protein [Paenibacillus sp. Z6-24]